MSLSITLTATRRFTAICRPIMSIPGRVSDGDRLSAKWVQPADLPAPIFTLKSVETASSSIRYPSCSNSQSIYCDKISKFGGACSLVGRAPHSHCGDRSSILLRSTLILEIREAEEDSLVLRQIVFW